MSGTSRRSAITTLLLAGLSGSVQAQRTLEVKPGVSTEVKAGISTTESRTTRRLFARPDLVGAGGVIAATLLLMPLDQSIASGFGSRAAQGSATLGRGAHAFNVAGEPGTVIASLGLWGAGLLVRSTSLADAGGHTTAAVALGSLVTGILKGIAGRQRPDVDAGDADKFSVGAGFRSGSNTSFPSGHTTAAFAFATALSRETRHWSPGTARVVTPILYAGATGVGLARMYDARHWASDVLLGAGIGTFAGLVVARISHSDRSIAGGRVSFAPVLLESAGSVTLGWGLTLR